jgi:hypothetical protein
MGNSPSAIRQAQRSEEDLGIPTGERWWSMMVILGMVSLTSGDCQRGELHGGVLKPDEDDDGENGNWSHASAKTKKRHLKVLINNLIKLHTKCQEVWLTGLIQFWRIVEEGALICQVPQWKKAQRVGVRVLSQMSQHSLMSEKGQPGWVGTSAWAEEEERRWVSRTSGAKGFSIFHQILKTTASNKSRKP